MEKVAGKDDPDALQAMQAFLDAFSPVLAEAHKFLVRNQECAGFMTQGCARKAAGCTVRIGLTTAVTCMHRAVGVLGRVLLPCILLTGLSPACALLMSCRTSGGWMTLPRCKSCAVALSNGRSVRTACRHAATEQAPVAEADAALYRRVHELDFRIVG